MSLFRLAFVRISVPTKPNCSTLRERDVKNSLRRSHQTKILEQDQRCEFNGKQPTGTLLYIQRIPIPLLDGNLNEPQSRNQEPLASLHRKLYRVTSHNETRNLPFSQSQISSPRMRAQTFRCSTHYDRDRLSRTSFEDIRTRLPANGTDTHS